MEICVPGGPHCGSLDHGSLTRKWKLEEQRARPRLCRELSTQHPRTRSQTEPFPHMMSRIYHKCKNRKTFEGFALVQKGYEDSQGERLSGQALPAEPPDGVCPVRTHFLRPAHTRSANVSGLMHGPRHLPLPAALNSSNVAESS